MASLYHVTREWDGGDLRSLCRLVDDGVMGYDAAIALLDDKWGMDERTAGDYLARDGREVHCHATLAEAIAYRDEWCEGGEILTIDADGLEVYRGAEYPHPVILDLIPAGRIAVVEAEVA